MSSTIPNAATAPTDAAARERRHASGTDTANRIDATPLKQAELTRDDGTVCRNEQPTGSRIAVKRCYSTTETAASKVQKEIERRNIEEMRDRQIYEQLRRASVATIPMGPAPR
jgi:hypothetical protein